MESACKEAGVPLGEDAPDYVIAPTGSPPLNVFQVANDPDGQSQEETTDEEE